MPLISKPTTVEPPNNESFGTANFFNYLEVFFINFNMRGFSLLEEFIIGGSTVAISMVFILTLLTLGIVIEHNEKVDCSFVACNKCNFMMPLCTGETAGGRRE